MNSTDNTSEYMLCNKYHWPMIEEWRR